MQSMGHKLYFWIWPATCFVLDRPSVVPASTILCIFLLSLVTDNSGNYNTIMRYYSHNSTHIKHSKDKIRLNNVYKFRFNCTKKTVSQHITGKCCLEYELCILRSRKRINRL